ncbi:MAG: hypothetical protein K6W08_13425 [Firmicutes bacterium]|nr:hypothetical protein [Bacillota bacterium]
MVFESRVGETFILGASTWRIEDILPDRVLVSPAPGEPGKMPFWHGDRPGRSVEFGRAIGALARALCELPEPAALARLTRDHALTEAAARSLLQYLKDQLDAAGVVPDDRTVVVERFKDEVGDWRICLLSPFGGQVHGPWAMAIGAAVRRRYGLELDILWTDDGIAARFPELDEPPPPGILLPDPDEVEDLVVEHLGAGRAARQAQQAGGTPTSLFAARFREAAARALLLPRRFPGQRVPLWQKRRRAADLFTVAACFPTFPIVLETFRECLRDVFDIPACCQLLRQIAGREIRVVTVDSRRPSPFAAALLFNYVANFMYEGDAPLAEARAQALLVDPTQLRELLGHGDLRELLDADALAQYELWLQHLGPQRAVRHADALHDLLRDLGDLSVEEMRVRAIQGADLAGWLARLEREGRAVRLQIAGEERYVAVEDVARYRDALGVHLPDGLPGVFLEPPFDPLGDLVARYARTHGPFVARDVARRLGLGLPPVLEALGALERAGRIVGGEFRPGGSGREWCETEVLRTLRRRSLARLRHAVEPVDGPSLGRFYLDWHGLVARRHGREGLLAVLTSLQGAAIPASVLERDVLPARLADYDPRLLDELMASGAVVWTGVEPLAPRDGRIRLFLADAAPLLFQSPGGPGPDGAVHRKIRETLAARGALFFPQLLEAIGGGFVPEVLEALWDLVWAGEVTNDTLRPLRAYVNPGRYRRRPGNRSWQTERIRRPGLVGSGLGLPAEASGRWSLTQSLVTKTPTPAERLVARARQLLERHGVLTRDAVMVEGSGGGFAAVYGVLRAMEEAGRIRRGYFVAGLGGTQFALPGAADRLRAFREPPESMEIALLAATDPANPYGAALPWPERPRQATGRRPMRAAGAFVVLADGALVAWLRPREGQLLTFLEAAAGRSPGDVAHAVAGCLAGAVAAGRWSALLLREVDGGSVERSPMATALRDAGFAVTSQGYLIRLQPR